MTKLLTNQWKVCQQTTNNIPLRTFNKEENFDLSFVLHPTGKRTDNKEAYILTSTKNNNSSDNRPSLSFHGNNTRLRLK